MSNDIYARAERFFGRTSQVIVLAEECSELAAVAARAANGKSTIHSVAFVEEVADVAIMLEQVKRWIGDGVFDAAVARKLGKLSDRLDALGAPQISDASTTADIEMKGFGT